MPNIRIRAKAFLQIFCSQGCSYTNCLFPKKRNNSTENTRNNSKFNQFIYTLVCTYMLNIRIPALAVLQIFCSQGCSYTKCLCPKKENNSSENLRNWFKILSVHLHLILFLYAKYQDPSQIGSSAILFTRLFLYKMPMSIKGEQLNQKCMEYVQKLITSSTAWSVTICHISGSYP